MQYIGNLVSLPESNSFYEATESIKSSFQASSASNSLYQLVNLTLDGLVILILIVALIFVYSSLVEMRKEEASMLILALLVWDLAIYIILTEFPLSLNYEAILPADPLTLFGLLASDIIGKSNLEFNDAVSLSYLFLVLMSISLLGLIMSGGVDSWRV